jgi:hypothetical protein
MAFRKPSVQTAVQSNQRHRFLKLPFYERAPNIFANNLVVVHVISLSWAERWCGHVAQCRYRVGDDWLAVHAQAAAYVAGHRADWNCNGFRWGRVGRCICGILGCDLGGIERMETQEVISDPLGIGCGPEDLPLVFPEYIEPRTDIARVLVDFGRNAKFVADHCAGKLCPQFFHRICLRTEPTAEIPVEPGGVAAPVRLMPISA